MISTTSRCLVALIVTLSFSSGVYADAQAQTSFPYGSFHILSRYRFEHVNDDKLSPAAQRLKNANASTLRTDLGYQSAKIHGFNVRLDLEQVMYLGNNDFNNGSNGKTNFATVVDPSGIELDQAFIEYQSAVHTSVKLGRRYLTYRAPPFHRFIGTVLWRQNWQTMDAVSVTNKSFADTTINYAYVWNVNRIFGKDAPEPKNHFDSNSHLVNLQYTGLAAGKLEAYAYLLDFGNAAAFSTQTFGIRFHGKYPYNDSVSALYTAEYAHQSDYADNPAAIGAEYLLAELGASVKMNRVISNFTLKVSFEKLSGDGGADRFVTILGTNHAFQGWADRFVVTPGDGIEDLIVTAVAGLWGGKFIAAYHQLGSDNLNYDYGDELDLLYSRKFRKYFTLGIKYAAYDADRNTQNLLRNGSNSGVTNDVNKFWAWAQFKF